MEADVVEILKLDDYKMFVDTDSRKFCTSWTRRPVDLSAEVARSEGKGQLMAAVMLVFAGIFIVAGRAAEREVGDWGSVGRGPVAHAIGAGTLVFTVLAAILTFQRLCGDGVVAYDADG